MTFGEKDHLCFTLVDKPMEDVAPAAIGVARALWGCLAVNQHDRRRPHEIKDDQAARLAQHRLLLPQMGLSIYSAPNGQTLIEDPLLKQITRDLSTVLPDAKVLGIESWTEGKARVCQRLSFYSGGRSLRYLGATKGTLVHGWHWEEEGTVTPWENPDVLSKRHISARLPRTELLAIANRFEIDIETVISQDDKQATTVEFLCLGDPAAPQLVSDDYFDATRNAVELGIGDPMHLEPPDFEGARQ